MGVAPEFQNGSVPGASILLTELSNPGWWSRGRITTVALIVVTTLLILRKLFRSGGKKLHLPPGPKPLPIIGNLHQLSKLPQRSCYQLAQVYGPIMFIRIGQKPCVVVSSGEAAQEFTKEQDKSWCTRPSSMAAKIFTNYRDIAWAPYGSHWRHMRKICAMELFSQKRIDSFRPPRTEEFDAIVRSIYLASKDGQSVKIHPILIHGALNNITRMMLTKRYACLLFGVSGVGLSHVSMKANSEQFGDESESPPHRTCWLIAVKSIRWLLVVAT
jgi:hypothetical protein